ncbi:ATP-dependent RNA helicase HrpA [uncultured Umboniibacter sp.]|uniref:ATP-dependent RNA helicase HrpA n=1 Tax=uncultured Umboniibacter sp. TaxID=1798917 RepID=UPI00260C9F21|nr:ATP-dependent RNA helicase HrpA [uncultured Umboniibacter sp.]
MQDFSQWLREDVVKYRSLTNKIKNLQRKKKPAERLSAERSELVASAPARLEQKLAVIPKPHFDDALPISEKRAQIAELIRDNQVVVVAGETGSGKTTQLPKICLSLGLGARGLIGHTQPRRLAASSVATRIAEELGQTLGESVGYQVRFNDQSGANTAIKLMTDGILLAEMARDRWLSRYDVIIIDEAHERSLNIDFLLGYLKQLLPKRPDLKVVITSATIDVERFSEHFNGAPVIEVSGRSFPVDIEYRPLIGDESDADLSLYDGICEAVEHIIDLEKRGESPAKGDVLVFLPGEREIRETHKQLKARQFAHTEVLPLYARLSSAEQNKVFAPHRGRRIVLATNVAETSLTVPGIGYVIDPGLARLSRYSYRSKVQRLPIEAVSQASANQRAGRCGRLSHGLCIRLYSEEDFAGRVAFTEPEIMRSNLSAVILQMLNLKLGDIKQFPFVNAPDNRFINDGFKRLEEIAAVSSTGEMTDLGRKLSKLPIDPHLARMLFTAQQKNALREVLIIVSAIAAQDPRERPADKKAQADQKHAQWNHENSDFMAYVNLWDSYQEWAEDLSQSQLRKRCKQEYLSYIRMREWRDLYTQIWRVCAEMGWKKNHDAANYDAIHVALASGLLGQVAMRDGKDEYLGARQRRFVIFPGSSMRKKKPNWILSGQLLETSQVFAHQVAMIEPEWLLAVARHLVKYHYSEPYYSAKQGRVMAFERVTLYGLNLVEQKRVGYGDKDPVVARELFIRGCLVDGEYRAKAKFYQHNSALRKQIESAEEKTRRRDLLVDEEAIFQFYNDRIPAEICDLVSFETWRKDSEAAQPKLLFMSQSHLAQRDVAVDGAQFPTHIHLAGAEFKLRYRFEPGHAADGVSVVIPLQFLELVQAAELEWLVPGLLRDKCIALVKALPKAKRKSFVPVPDFVDRVMPRLRNGTRSLTQALSDELSYVSNVRFEPSDWQEGALDDFYRLNIVVVDERKKRLAMGRNLNQLRQQLKAKIQAALAAAQNDEIDTVESIVEWNFGDLPRERMIAKSGVKITAYPALVDDGESTSLQLFDRREEAQLRGVRGLARLVLLQLPTQARDIRKEVFRDNRIKLALAAICPRDQLIEDLLMVAAREVFKLQEWPADQAAFNQRVNAHRGEFLLYCRELANFLTKLLTDYAELRGVLRKTNSLALTFAVGDVKNQWAELFGPGFLWRTPRKWLDQYPRYLQASFKRLEQVQGKVQKDRLAIGMIDAYLPDVINKLKAEEGLMWESEAALVDFRFMIEEWRVQLFAQPMKTIVSVSEKRIKQAWIEASQQ